MNAVATAEAFAAPDAEIAFDAEIIPQKLFSIRGRVGVLKNLAQTFLWSLVFTVVAGAAVAAAAAMGMMNESFGGPIAGLVMLLMLPFFFVMVCFSIKRLHDLNMSGWFLLLAFVPIVNMFFILYMMFKPGKVEPNRFGAQSVTKGWEKVVGGIYIVLIVASFAAALFGVAAGGMSMFM